MPRIIVRLAGVAQRDHERKASRNNAEVIRSHYEQAIKAIEQGREPDDPVRKTRTRFAGERAE